jgi:predicted Zn-dependent protease
LTESDVTDRIWTARYQDGRNASVECVTIRATPIGLEVSGASGTETWRFTEIRQTQGFAPGEQVRIERGEEPAEAFVVDDQSILDAIHSVSVLAGQFDRRETRNRRFSLALIALIAFIAVAAAGYSYVLPPLAERLADSLPATWEVQLGETVVGLLAPTHLRIEDPALAPLTQMLNVLIDVAPPADYEFRITVVNEEDVNAFAAPGGHVVLFSGLIASAESPDEVAGVLAHEVQHVLNRHGTKALFRELAWLVLWSSLAGDAEGFGQILEGAGQLAGLSYRRKDESEADAKGMALIQKARIDPNGMGKFYRRLLESQIEMPSQLVYLSTHPRTENRIEVLEEMASEVTYQPVQLMSDEEWESLKRVCTSSVSQ